MTETIICGMCEQDKPKAEFGKSGKRDWYRKTCRECHNASRRGENPYNKFWCRQCKSWKDRDKFNRDDSMTSGVRGQCKVCQYASQKSSGNKGDDELHAEEQAAEAFRVFVEMDAKSFEAILNAWSAQKLRKLRYYLPLYYALSDIHKANTTPHANNQIVMAPY